MYTWMVVVSAFFCAAMAWGIGANDVANFFGPAVGARSITLKRAMIIAFIFEFIGAFFLGSTVTNTIRKKIVAFDDFNGEADILLLGMFSALTAAALWVYIATKHSLPISTTQSIVGAIIGFVLVSKGPDAIEWDAVTNIIIFWVGTPLMGCIACFIFYTPVRHFILSKENSYSISLTTYPLFVFIVIFIMITFLLFKGLKRLAALGAWSEANPGFVVLIGIGAGTFFALIAYLALVKTGIVNKYAEHERVQKAATKDSDVDDVDYELKQIKVTSASDINTASKYQSRSPIDADEVVEYIQSELHKKPTNQSEIDTCSSTKKVENKPEAMEKQKEKANEAHTNASKKFMAMGNKLKLGLEVDIFDDLTKTESDLQKFSTKFDAKTERLFEWLSVLAATFGIFAHGSNDIANAIAPFSSILVLSQQSAGDDIEDKNAVSVYVLLMGSIFMSIGCITYGYNVIKTMGVKLAKLSPSRGYFTQVAAALVIIIASNYGFPASTTHAQVGATVAIGLVEKIYNKELKWNQVFNWKLLLQVFFGWIATILIAGLTSALIYSVLAYSPCV